MIKKFSWYYLKKIFRIFTRISSFVDWIERNKKPSGTTTLKPSPTPISSSSSTRPSSAVSSSSSTKPSSAVSSSLSSSSSSSSARPASGCPLGFLGDNCEIG